MILSWLKRLFRRFDIDVTDRPKSEQESAPSAVEKQVTFRYKYLDYPFGTWQYFGVKANSQDEADMAAINQFQILHTEGYTVMRDFYRANLK